MLFIISIKARNLAATKDLCCTSEDLQPDVTTSSLEDLQPNMSKYVREEFTHCTLSSEDLQPNVRAYTIMINKVAASKISRTNGIC